MHIAQVPSHCCKDMTIATTWCAAGVVRSLWSPGDVARDRLQKSKGPKTSTACRCAEFKIYKPSACLRANSRLIGIFSDFCKHMQQLEVPQTSCKHAHHITWAPCVPLHLALINHSCTKHLLNGISHDCMTQQTPSDLLLSVLQACARCWTQLLLLSY